MRTVALLAFAASGWRADAYGAATLAVRPPCQHGTLSASLKQVCHRARRPLSMLHSTTKNVHDKDIAALASPALLSLLVDPILSVIDTMYVGRLGPTEIASLGPCTSVFHFSFNTFRALTQSTTALISRSLARNEARNAGDIAQQSIALGLCLGLVVAALLLRNADGILSLMGAQHGTALFAQARSYLTVRAAAAPAVLLIMVMEGVFRGHGDTVTPAIASVVAALANLVLDPVLMFGCGWGVAGAAAATAAAQYLAVLTYAALLVRRVKQGKMSLPALVPAGAGAAAAAEAAAASAAASLRSRAAAVAASARKTVPLLRTIVSANAAMLMRTVSLMACWAVATGVATRMGAVHVAAHQVVLSLWLLFALVAEAPSIAAQVLGARYLGQGRVSTARAMGSRAYQLTLAASLGLAAMLLVLSQYAPGGVSFLPSCFTRDPALLAKIQSLIPALVVQQPLVASTLVMEGLLVGAGEFRWLGVTTAVGTAASAAGILALGRSRNAWGVQGVWVGITGMFVLRFASAAFRLLDRRHGPYWRMDAADAIAAAGTDADIAATAATARLE
ncbi:unnamed protein product [Phaeothamnion confervicola]